jgi:hypothetical protein
MAKRPTTRSKANDPAAEPAAPKPKRTRIPGAEQAPMGPPAEPSHDDIRHRAYERYLARGGDHGLHVDDWVEAEKELKSRK